MDQPLSERMLRALLIQLLKSEAIDPDDIGDAAERLAKHGDDEAAHALRCVILESLAPEQSDWDADQRRSRFRVVGDDGKPT